MDQFSSPIPTPEPKPGPAGWFNIWIKAVTSPSEQTYSDLSATPGASAGTAYLWVFLASLLSFFVTFLIQIAVASLGNVQQGQDVGSLIAGSAIYLICALPFVAGFAVLAFIIRTGIIQWVAGLFKGTGTFNQLAYTFGAITTPVTIVSTVLSLIYAIPFVGFCLWPISILLFLYVAVLEVMAIKGVNKFGWGEAIGSWLIPLVAICILCACLAFAASMVLGPVIGNVFSEINSSLGGY